MGRSKYHPWQDLPDDARLLPHSVADRIRFGYPAFERLPACGDWFRGRLDRVRVRVSALSERGDELRVSYFDTERNDHFSLPFSTFLLVNTFVAGRPARTLADEITPAGMLAGAGLTRNDIYRMALAVEVGHGRWRGIYRQLGIAVPQKHQWGYCPVCQQRHDERPTRMQFRSDPREDPGYGICHCIMCGQHAGLDLIAGATGLSLSAAASRVLAVTGDRQPEVTDHAQ
ncbi:hypothetical protein [Cedecea sp. NFIX57]|uniref:hypothetical protein n=1 Tax=Cedecea sp. NFIX57 TaxID=1566286 RepID=UPI000A0DE2A5|nr:hypothetical protein [Cedecea sp. NFIX57]SMG61813.1 hypothetical protein SAMN03159353_10625 [Cedecea sp. NFIX57]